MLYYNITHKGYSITIMDISMNTHKKAKIALLVSGLISTSINAKILQGVVLDQQNNPIENANIRLESGHTQVTTDSHGQFQLPASAGEHDIHIFTKGFAHLHQRVDIPQKGAKNRKFVLSPSAIEVIDVVAAPVHLSVMESATPVSVLGGEPLRRQQAATLGDSLEKLVGVHSNFHAHVASTPIIRGLSGPRVMIAKNGLDVGDVSRTGPDHSVAAEASTARQIEVLRGPATLFYGSGAIGGVVNVVDERVPTSNQTHGEWSVERSTVNDQNLASFNVTSGFDSFAVYADGYWRDSDSYEIPLEPGVVANSQEESNGYTLGTSYLFEQGYVGIAVEQFNREYGIPGHSHGGDDHADGESDEAESVFADLEQTQIQILSEINLDNSRFLKKVTTRAAFSDYQHMEVENGEVGTLFDNESHEIRLELHHQSFNDWQGGVSFQLKSSDFSAVGEEAFTPPSSTDAFAVALMEEKHFQSLLFQFGARLERVTISADNLLLPSVALHGHDEDDHHADEHDHDHEDEASLTRVFGVEQTFTPMSFSGGVVWRYLPGYNFAVLLSHSERAPSATELMSFGPHIGTGSYEVGALFELEQTDHQDEFKINSKPIELETSQNIDLTLRKTQGEFGFVFNAFYNRVDNYYYQSTTGLFAEFSHDHAHEDVHEDEHDHNSQDEDEHSDELPVYWMTSDDVVLKGFEAQVAWQALPELKLTVLSDYVSAELQNGEPLPRTPPFRLGGQVSYTAFGLNTDIDIIRYQSQDKITEYETQTAGYTLINAHFSVDLKLLDLDTSVYLSIKNLTDTEARVHSSFLKDIAPRPGRNFSFGLRGYF